AGRFVALRLAGRLGDPGRAEALHVGEAHFAEGRDGDTVAEIAVVVDLHLRAGGECGGAGGVVDGFAHLRQIDGVGVADVEIGLRAVGDDVGRGAAFGDHALNAGLGAHRRARGVDVVEEVDD